MKWFRRNRPAQVFLPMSGDDAALHPEPGTVCAVCDEPFRKTDAVRRTTKGIVHDVCPGSGRTLEG